MRYHIVPNWLYNRKILILKASNSTDRPRPNEDSSSLDTYSTIGLTDAIKRNFHIPIPLETQELLSPLDQENTVRGYQVVQTKSLQLSGRVNAIQVDVIKVRSLPAILVDQRKRGTGNVFFFPRSKSGSDSFYKCGLSGAEIAAQENEFRRRKQLR